MIIIMVFGIMFAGSRVVSIAADVMYWSERRSIRPLEFPGSRSIRSHCRSSGCYPIIALKPPLYKNWTAAHRPHFAPLHGFTSSTSSVRQPHSSNLKHPDIPQRRNILTAAPVKCKVLTKTSYHLDDSISLPTPSRSISQEAKADVPPRLPYPGNPGRAEESSCLQEKGSPAPVLMAVVV